MYNLFPKGVHTKLSEDTVTIQSSYSCQSNTICNTNEIKSSEWIPIKKKNQIAVRLRLCMNIKTDVLYLPLAVQGH